MTSIILRLVLAFAVLAAPLGAGAAVVILGAAKDNSLYIDAAGSLSNATGPNLFAGTTGGGLVRRGLLEFDVSIIPAGSVVTSVTLQLFLAQAQAFPTAVTLHEVAKEWGEGTSGTGVRGGGGTSATANDATWLHTFYVNQFWTTPGGDFDPNPSASTIVGAEGAGYTWSSSSALVADVQGWVNSASSNHGWLLRGDESQNGTAKAFATREYSDSTKLPTLTIQYIPIPEPHAALLLLCAGGLVAMRRRSR